MTSPPFLRRLKKPSMILLRRVAGASMAPALPAGTLVLAALPGLARAGRVIVFTFDGREYIKRVHNTDPARGVYVLGDNADASTDSRDFGWVPHNAVQGIVLWPRRSAPKVGQKFSKMV